MPVFNKLKGIHSPLPGSFRSTLCPIHARFRPVVAANQPVILGECDKAAQILDAFTNPANLDGPDSLIPPKILAAAKVSRLARA